MKIVSTFPPNYEQLKARFGESQDVIFCYGDTIYNPFNKILRDDLIVHEERHAQQQAKYEADGNGGPDAFFNRYVTDNDFMVDIEAEAYADQLMFLLKKDPDSKNTLLNKFAEYLTRPEYGGILDLQEATEKIEKWLFVNYQV